MFLWCYLYYNDKAVYDVWLRIAVAGAPDMFLVDSECFFFPKWKPIVMNVQHLKLWVSSYHLLSTSWLNKPVVVFYVWGLESLSSPCTVFALMPFKNIHLSSDLFTLALIEAVWFAYRWQLKGIRDQEMEHGAKMSTLSTVNVFELTYFYVVPSDALPCVSVFIHTLFSLFPR